MVYGTPVARAPVRRRGAGEERHGSGQRRLHSRKKPRRMGGQPRVVQRGREARVTAGERIFSTWAGDSGGWGFWHRKGKLMGGDEDDRRRNSRPIAPCRLCWSGVCCCICVCAFQPRLFVHGEGDGWEGLGRGEGRGGDSLRGWESLLMGFLNG